MRLGIGCMDQSISPDTDVGCNAATKDVARKLEAMGHHVENVYPDALNRSGEFTDDFMAAIPKLRDADASVEDLCAAVGRSQNRRAGGPQRQQQRQPQRGDRGGGERGARQGSRRLRKCAACGQTHAELK